MIVCVILNTLLVFSVSINSPTACDLSSRHELEVFVASSLSALPFPPMPVMCVGFEDRDSRTVNSHDLLGTAILNELHLAKACTRTKISDTLKSKQDLLQNLLRDIYTLYQCTTSKEECVSKCYVVFGRAFCRYITFYTSCCDVRFAGLDTIQKSDFIFQQAQRHFKTHFEVDQEFNNYRDILWAYVEQISALVKQDTN